MAWIAADSFDSYSSGNDLGHNPVWDAAGNNLVPLGPNTGRFGVGQGAQGYGGGAGVSKNFGNEPVVFILLAHYRSTYSPTDNWQAVRFQLRDGFSNQCFIGFLKSGAIEVRSGDVNGTVVATFPNALAPQDTWHHFQMRVTIHNTAGELRIRKNGAPTDTFVATNINTRGGSSNNYANAIDFSVAALYDNQVDDLLIYSASGAAPNNWLGDVRAITLPASSDTAQKQFSGYPASLTVAVGPSQSGGYQQLTVNTLYVTGPFRPTRGGQLISVNASALSAMSGHFKAALYYDDGTPPGSAGTLLAVSNEVTALTTPTTTFPFSGVVPITPARNYWVGFIQDVSWNCIYGGGQPASCSIQWKVASYASGFPNPMGGGLTAQPAGSYFSSPIIIGGNSVYVGELAQNGDTDYVFDGTVGDSELYGVASLPVTPVQIIGVVSKVLMKKSDAGTRNGQLLMQSGATQVTGPDTILASTNYNYQARIDVVDPNTGLAWTLPAVNAVQIGFKVTA
jgi:hypothetical protein